MKLEHKPGTAAGIDPGHGLGPYVAESAQEFADNVHRLIEDPQRSARLGEQARKYVLGRYDWAASADRLMTLLERESCNE